MKKELGETPQLHSMRSKINENQKVLCPHCHADDIYGHGTYKGRKKYKCKQCSKTFNDFTGTAISGIKKVDKFQEYLELTIESASIRKAAKKIKISTNTIFDWRHKILTALSMVNGNSFVGIVECDDKQFKINEKGSHKLDRKAYKRPSNRQTKRGISNDKLSVMVATDRNGNPLMKIAKMGIIDADSIEKTIGTFVSNDNILCSDSHPSIVLWAKNKELEHHTFVASRQHVKSKCYHVQHVNSLDNRYERWIKPFYGVATKCFSQYLNWFVFIQKIKKSSEPVKEFANIIMTNIDKYKNSSGLQGTYLSIYH